MAPVKKSSTIQENKAFARMSCPVTYLMDKIGNYWKPFILYHLFKGDKRYSELRRAIPGVTEKMLIQNLKQLEADKLIIREAKPVVPPFVTYRLSDSGRRLKPVIDAMIDWSNSDAKGTFKGKYNKKAGSIA